MYNLPSTLTKVQKAVLRPLDIVPWIKLKYRVKWYILTLGKHQHKIFKDPFLHIFKSLIVNLFQCIEHQVPKVTSLFPHLWKVYLVALHPSPNHILPKLRQWSYEQPLKFQNNWSRHLVGDVLHTDRQMDGLTLHDF